MVKENNKLNKNIVMIGDSIANQFAGVIAENNGDIGYNFMNKCIGGESTLDTMARLGAIPYTVLPPFTIPADTSNSEEVLNNIKERVNDYIIEKGEKVSIEGRIHTEEEKEAAAEYNLSPAKYKIIEYLFRAKILFFLYYFYI